MHNKTFTYNGVSYRQVAKPRAKRAFISGADVAMIGCNMNPNSVWCHPYVTNIRRCYTDDFELFVNEFIYYNCDNERGRYPSYFIAEDG